MLVIIFGIPNIFGNFYKILFKIFFTDRPWRERELPHYNPNPTKREREIETRGR